MNNINRAGCFFREFLQTYLAAIVLMIFSTAIAFCQVDTLELLETGVLESPLWILEHYFVDLDLDGRKEIILCDVYNIHVYDSETFASLWTSPILHLPTKLVFEDINSDGLIDIAAEDDYRIYLFDPHASVTIWSSPLLDNRYNCYAMGDRNGDGWGDVAIITNEVFSRYDDCNNLDTTWISVYDGPSYDDPDTTVVLLPNYDCYFLDIWHKIALEEVFDAELVKLSGTQNLEPALVLFSRIDTVLMVDGAPGYLQGILGRTIVVNGMTLNQSYSAQCGLKFNDRVVESNSQRYMYVITWTAWGVPFFGDINLFASKLGANSPLFFRNIHSWPMVIYHFWDWCGSMIDEIYSPNSEYEVCFGADDTLFLQGLEHAQPLWSLENLSGLREVLFTVHDPRVFTGPQVVCKIDTDHLEFRFYDGIDGALTGILLDPGRELTATTDLEGDGIDEIFGLHRKWLHIYHIDTGMRITEPQTIPEIAFLNGNYPNPFNTSTTIEFALPEPGRVRIDIYDLLGRKVKTLIDNEMQAGQHKIVWDASGYSSGVYFYRIEAENYVETRRMVYLK